MQSRFPLMRIVAVALLIYALALFVNSAREVAHAEAELAGLEASIAEEKLYNQQLLIKLESVESGEGIERAAREKLGLVLPGEKIFYFTEEQEFGETEPNREGA